VNWGRKKHPEVCKFQGGTEPTALPEGSARKESLSHTSKEMFGILAQIGKVKESISKKSRFQINCDRSMNGQPIIVARFGLTPSAIRWVVEGHLLRHVDDDTKPAG
jgi:hypothetical protein